jgi:hypothetical protein
VLKPFKKAKVMAAQRSTSISELSDQQIELLVVAEEAYESARRSALAMMDRGFHLGGVRSVSRDELHER